MTLRQATSIALFGTIIKLLIKSYNWAIYYFTIYFEYSDRFGVRYSEITIDLLDTIPLIIFFAILRKKQKGD